MITESELKAHCHKVKDKRRGFDCLCNCHADHIPSFHWEIKEVGWVGGCIVCGAKGEDFAKTAGINVKDLFIKELPKREWMSKQKYAYEKNCIAKYPYYRIDNGTQTHIKYRMKPYPNGKKNMPQGYDKDGEWVGSLKDIDTSLSIFCNGSIDKLKENAKRGQTILYAEGEKDVLTGAKYGHDAFTCGSKEDWKPRREVFKYIKDAQLVIFADNDDEGIKSANGIKENFEQIGGQAVVIIPPGVPEKGDISDYMEIHTKEDLKNLIDDAIRKNTVTEKTVSSVNVSAPQARQDEEIDYTQFHFYNNKGEPAGINHNAIAEDIKAKHSLFVSGCFYESDRGHYKPDTTGAKIKGYIKQRILPDMRKSQVINQIYSLLHDDFSIERDFKDTNLYPARWIPFNDCLLDPLTFEEIAYDDKYFCTNRLPHRWKDCKNAAEGKEIEKFLRFAIPDEQDREMALGFDGLSCNRDTSFQKAMLHVGQGGTGKSIKIRLLQAMLGAENYSNIGLFDLGKRFMPGLLLGKLANICSDLPIKALPDEASEALKLITGEDVIFHESKGQNGFFFTPYCKMTFSTNLLPQVLDERNNAVFRRLLILRMDNVPEQPDVNLFSKLEKELPCYIRLCMEALHRIYERECILESENSKNEINQMRRDSDTTEDFIDVCCVKESGARIDRGELFAKYEKHCENEGRQSLSKNAFNKAIRAKGYKQVKSCGYWYFEGISLKKVSLNLPVSSEKTSLNGVEVDANGFMKIDEEALKDLPFT